MMSMQKTNIPFNVVERQRCVNLRKICPSRGVGFSGFKVVVLTRGMGKNSGGPGGKTRGGGRPPSELCFGTSEIEWSYIMYTFLTLL